MTVMTDPRITRTEEHVYRSLEVILRTTDVTALTFASIAAAASVSRRTLHEHWETLPHLWASLFTHFYLPMPPMNPDLPAEDQTVQALTHIRNNLATTVTRSVFLAADETGATRRMILTLWKTELSERLRLKLDAEIFTQLVGPLCTDALFLATRTSDAAIRKIARAY